MDKRLSMRSINSKVYNLKDLEQRLSEELEDRFELGCWSYSPCTTYVSVPIKIG